MEPLSDLYIHASLKCKNHFYLHCQQTRAPHCHFNTVKASKAALPACISTKLLIT
ncbi:hypothetical protein GBA52_001162 [Prunus armeniaca]|nr:hypothetical protein GBA52_001162 [Prunus armeniaca]